MVEKFRLDVKQLEELTELEPSSSGVCGTLIALVSASALHLMR
jgi:hypothetical protein